MTCTSNTLTDSIAKECARRPTEEKWLIAPSLRVGFQWLESVTWDGSTVVNFNVKTFRTLVLELASPTMQSRGLDFLRGVRAELMVEAAFETIRGTDAGYLSSLELSPGLTRTLHRTVRDLRMAGLTSAEMRHSDFEVELKGREIAAILAGYEMALEEENLVDYPGALHLAIASLRRGDLPWNDDVFVYIPKDILHELKGLERNLWEAIPGGNKVELHADVPADSASEPTDNIGLLSWIGAVGEAPPSFDDSTVKMFRAIGEVNEVREVLRRCVEERVPFDEVEILHADSETYVPLLFELAHHLQRDESDEIPVTFVEGVPTAYSKPGHILRAWVQWIKNEWPQATLVQMVQDGLLKIPGFEKAGFGYARLGAMLRAVPIGAGYERYLKKLDETLEALEREVGSLGEEDDSHKQERLSSVKDRIAGLGLLRPVIVALLEISSPTVIVDDPGLLQSALVLLDQHVNKGNRYDEYSRARLVAEIEGLLTGLESIGTCSLKIKEWLAELPGATFAEGLGPRAGRIHVAPLSSGGFSGRPHTFIVGLDDTRFPGTGGQDPLVLDEERSRISDQLVTSAGRLAASMADFSRLLARLRGRVTLSYCCRSLTDDHEMFPSPVVLSCYRILEKRDGDQEDLAKYLGEPASFAPDSPDGSIDMTEWWLSQLCGKSPTVAAPETLGLSFPNLFRGFTAREARLGGEFTRYDGYVPEAGPLCDPSRPDGRVYSASALEQMAKCPMEYFFRSVLGIRRPDEFSIDPRIWLEATERGTLLHEVFRSFMTRLADRGERPEVARHQMELNGILSDETDKWALLKPPPNSLVFEREKEDMLNTAKIFLIHEEEHCRESRPEYCEAAMGLPQRARSTEIDCLDPVKVLLVEGLYLLAHGRIDRIDRLDEGDGKQFAIWDYKTGSDYGYNSSDPFYGGRHIQNILYVLMANHRILSAVPGANVASFGYFFPSAKGQGNRVEWDNAQLEAGVEILADLCRMLATGCFPFTTNPDADLYKSDYEIAFGDVKKASEDIKRKLRDPGNAVLEPFRRLRKKEF